MSAKRRGRKKGQGGESEPRSIAENRKARHRFEILETFEAGISLTGNEVKSLRQGGMSLGESYARVRGREIYLVDCQSRPTTGPASTAPTPGATASSS